MTEANEADDFCALYAGGQARLDYFKQVVSVPRLNRIGMSLSFDGFLNGDLWIALITFLYVDFLDTTGTLFSSASFLNNFVPGFVRQDKVSYMHLSSAINRVHGSVRANG